jgi:hypothetical protein
LGYDVIGLSMLFIFMALVSSTVHCLNINDKICFTGILFDIIDDRILFDIIDGGVVQII